MPDQPDDLDAVREIAKILVPFDEKSREIILRWVREKVGMTSASSSAIPTPTVQVTGTHSTSRPTDIQSFIKSKAPKTHRQLAAVVAYYHKFEAPEGERKAAIDQEDLKEACRKANFARPSRAAMTLVDAYKNAGLLDRASAGKYTINSVGENLVAMTLPETGEATVRQKPLKKSKPRPSSKK